ncbi:hypothetical protein PDJAM_G00072840 [Pangasius djambal]|uniref:Uncharacterized protein n=1 Tax=Pangasius djambal TaxID=1691987 RepID=A0ACC5Z163_9TELE|nr:hypothetical protein [Pangasius djambal]
MGSTEVATEGQRGVQADGGGSEGVPTDSGGDSSVSMSNEVMAENTPVEDQVRKVQEEKETLVTNSLSEMSKPLAQTDSSTQTQVEEQDKVVEKKAIVDGSQKMAAVLGQEKTEACQEPTSSIYTKSSECQRNKISPEKEATDKKVTPDTPNRRRMAANLSLDHGLGHGPKTSSPAVEKKQAVANEEKAEAASKQENSPGSWCQTQLPEMVAEGQVGAGTIGESSPGGREREGGRRDKSGRHEHNLYAGIDSSSLGRKKTVYVQEQRDTSHGAACRIPYCSPYSFSGGAAYDDLQGGDANADWQMDSVIEQIEKQMAAVLEKIEGDMPSLLEQIKDCPESLPRAKSAHSSPSFRHRSYQDRSTPPPLPTTPRPPMPSLPHLTIPPPSYPPPNPPIQTQSHNQLATEQDERDGQRGTARLSQSPRGGVSGKGL